MGARRAGALTLVLLLATLVLGAQTWRGGHASVPLLQAGVVAEPDGSLRTVSESAWAAQRDIDTVDPWLTVSRSASLPWLASGTVPGLAGPDAAMAVRALADLRVLTAPTGTSPGAVLAGPSGAWGYVWPRDAAFVAAAYARTGHQDDAIAVLLFLARQQEQDGSMQARYLADGSGQPPDDREAQEDGPGWSLWAAREVIDAAPDRASAAAATRALVPLVTRSTARLLDRIDPGTNLPAPSPDYWEVPESRLTLGIAATALMGLEAAADVYERGLVGDDAWWAAQFDPSTLPAAARTLRGMVRQEFGPDYPRHVGGEPDAAVTFLLPPYLRCPVDGAQRARLAAQPAMGRPAGGLAPGAGWKQDGISWTPETALQALAAAAGDEPEEARRWLDWLRSHRTEAGSLPEKVLHDGSPAAVAPLAWTSAIVLLAIDELEQTPHPARPDRGCP